MRQPNRKAPLIFRVGLMLLCAMLVTTNMMGGLYARYSTTATGSANARVAKFDVTSNCVYDAETENYILTITNNSDVTVVYNISYTVDNAALPTGVTITFEKGNSGTLAYGATIKGKLSFSENYSSYHEESIVDVIVTVSQVD